MSSSCGDHWRSGPNGRFAVLQGNPERRLPVRADGNGRHIVRDRGRLKLSVKSMWDRSPSSAHVSANNYDVNGEDRGEAASDAAASESIDRWRGGGSAKSAPPPSRGRLGNSCARIQLSFHRGPSAFWEEARRDFRRSSPGSFTVSFRLPGHRGNWDQMDCRRLWSLWRGRCPEELALCRR